MRHRNHHVFRRNQIFHTHILSMGDDFAAALVTVLRFNGNQLVDDNLRYALWLGQDIEQIDNLVHHFAIFADDFILFQPG